MTKQQLLEENKILKVALERIVDIDNDPLIVSERETYEKKILEDTDQYYCYGMIYSAELGVISSIAKLALNLEQTIQIKGGNG